MSNQRSSSHFTNEAFGPPLIGALLRTPWEAVQRRMLALLHERGFDDLDGAHLNVFQYPGPQGASPSALAAMSLARRAPRLIRLLRMTPGACSNPWLMRSTLASTALW